MVFVENKLITTLDISGHFHYKKNKTCKKIITNPSLKIWKLKKLNAKRDQGSNSATTHKTNTRNHGQSDHINIYELISIL